MARTLVKWFEKQLSPSAIKETTGIEVKSITTGQLSEDEFDRGILIEFASEPSSKELNQLDTVLQSKGYFRSGKHVRDIGAEIDDLKLKVKNLEARRMK